MKKYINIIWMMAVVIIAGTSFASCSDDDDFPNKPQVINIEQDIVLTPINGGVQVDWTPNPADTNFVFLHIEFQNQDGATCRYNLSRYNSSLVTETETEEAASLTITNLVNQEYTLHFSAFNNQNKSIDLGSRKVTPLDYKACEPDSIFGVKATGGVDYMVHLEWQEPPHKSGSTTEGVRFVFTNKENPSLQFTKEFGLGIWHASFEVEKKFKGEYNMTYGTYSEAGKEFTKSFGDLVLVGLPAAVEYWSKTSRADWTITGCTDIADAGSGHFADMLDGKADTYWHSSYSNPDDKELPHHFTVDIKKSLAIEKCLFQQRNSWNRQVSKIKIYISETDGNWGEPVYDGALTTTGNNNIAPREDIKFTPKNGRFIKVETWEGTGGTLHCMAEFGIVAREIITEE